MSREVDDEAIDGYLSVICAFPRRKPLSGKFANSNRRTGCAGKTGKIETKRYWSAGFFNTKIKITEEEAIVETTQNSARINPKLRMISEVPLGAFLSGGVDSSIVVALMAQESAKRR